MCARMCARVCVCVSICVCGHKCVCVYVLFFYFEQPHHSAKKRLFHKESYIVDGKKFTMSQCKYYLYLVYKDISASISEGVFDRPLTSPLTCFCNTLPSLFSSAPGPGRDRRGPTCLGSFVKPPVKGTCFECWFPPATPPLANLECDCL